MVYPLGKTYLLPDGRMSEEEGKAALLPSAPPKADIYLVKMLSKKFKVRMLRQRKIVVL